MQSPAAEIATRLVRSVGKPAAHAAIDAILSKFTNVELAALAFHWETWARPKQLAPRGDWRSWGFLTGRGFGKTFGISKWINDQVAAGRARQIGLAAQDESNCIALQVLGPSGLIATAPPWNRPHWESTLMRLVWPSGAIAIVRTPEVPGKIRGFDYDLVWLTEIQSWPHATREEAFSNFQFATRVGHARTIWDATPKRRNPILRELVERAAKESAKHVVVRGTTHENALNLAPGYIEELEARYGGTQRGKEELYGELLEDSEGALVKQAWIDDARRHHPESLTRRVIGIDPAVTTRAGNDRTGIVDCGLGVDDQVYVLGDYTGKYKPEEWGPLVVDKYLKNGCDLVVVETNKGGQLVTQNLRSASPKRGLQVVVVGPNEKPTRRPGTLFVKEVHARGPKEDRAQPLATAYERGRVSHVLGVDLATLEDTLTTWEPTPGARSPDALDALTHASIELMGLLSNTLDKSVGIKGIAAMGKALSNPIRQTTGLATLLNSASRPSRI